MESGEKKEKVLHARIPESLDHEVRRHAKGLGISVSNLVRNVLLNSFGLVEDIVVDSARIARTATGGAEPRPVALAPGGGGAAESRIVGWRELRLNLNAVCAECNGVLPKGTRAAMAVWHPAEGPLHTICTDCLERIGGTSPEP